MLHSNKLSVAFWLDPLQVSRPFCGVLLSWEYLVLSHGWWSLGRGTQNFLAENDIVLILTLTCQCFESCGWFGFKHGCFTTCQRQEITWCQYYRVPCSRIMITTLQFCVDCCFIAFIMKKSHKVHCHYHQRGNECASNLNRFMFPEEKQFHNNRGSFICVVSAKWNICKISNISGCCEVNRIDKTPCSIKGLLTFIWTLYFCF